MFNEDSRVKIPTILHLMRLGYEYLSLKGQTWDKETNIFPEFFKEAIARLNPDMREDDIPRLLEDIKLTLDNEDLGQAFYQKLIERSGTKLIDFENFSRNSFHVVTELPCKNGDDSFRPDITLLINGLPLVFIEVKKPANKEGVLAEHKRIEERFQNPKFRRFINITQLMIFSNNMEYDEDSILPVKGAFYASVSYKKPVFNYFREEALDLSHLLKLVSDEQESKVLKDNNLEVIKHNPEFITNKEPRSPTNRICTSLLSRERLAFMLQYAFAYVHERDGIQKHVMRYPQLFATKAIERTLEDKVKKGIVWHTQGSGKTALTYYNVRYLTDYYQNQEIVPKFYFIVDRIDLLIQAQREFSSRGLVVHVIDSREEFARDIKATQAIHNHSGKPEITVVNIQKFENDPNVIQTKDYDVSIQRVYFLDEVHRSYKPTGSFLANLIQSDPNAVKIGLTGTPLILGVEQLQVAEENKKFASKQIFGDYIHKYYYDKSIADGYTLRLIREEIETSYKLELRQVLKDLEVQQGDINKRQIYAHTRFVEPMLAYIIQDFEDSRRRFGDNTIGGMVICDSADQARKMFEIFNEKYAAKKAHSDSDNGSELLEVADSSPGHSVLDIGKLEHKVTSAALILSDYGTKQERKDWVEDFKEGKIDFLFVYNMLLTGFDAKRLKKLYLGRVIKKHNLLQALTRVNRTYKDFRYGYVVDFADIRKEFDATNKAYFDELQSELGDEIEHYSNLFKSQEEILADIEHIKDVLFMYDTENAEIFSTQIEEIQDKQKIQVLKKALEDAKSLYNLIRLQGDVELLEKLDFNKFNVLYSVASSHLDMLNLRERLEQGNDTTNLLNVALEEVIFKFTKVGEEELILADKLKNTLRQTREAMASNFDQQDPKFITLKEELERLFKKKKLNEVTQEEMNKNIGALRRIHERVKELNRQNNQLRQKYHGDAKYTRVHKRLREHGGISDNERRIFEALMGFKQVADAQVLMNTQILQNESYFEQSMMPLVIQQFMKNHGIKLTPDAAKYINKLVVAEYMKEYNTGVQKW
ncbi:TPA: type I restriction endonuclease subunit R [Vibrio alginolyticus]|uniref:type I restriction endonuclease subunit R n=1 Tax=Vibrio alginolyticus TaxID=663 RepID=UPI003E1240C4